ncbi:MAG: fibronectin type III domain-containing protein, partial [Candidatus Omnitrophica bacterium]|nr:fibronectin type III domain-containing protein [Candidatus Omnitrophota bacterium]
YIGTGSGVYGPAISLNNLTTYTAGNLLPATKYYCAVSALSSGVEGPKSTEIVVSTTPAAPILNTADGGNNQAALNWSAVIGADSYKVYYGTASGIYSNSVPAGNVTNFVVRDLQPGTNYYFAVSAVNAGGEGPKSNEISAVTVPPAPQLNMASGSAAQAASLSWNSAAGATSYLIYYGTSSGVYDQKVTPFPDQTTGFTVSYLKPGTTYYFAVAAKNASGESGKSNEIMTMTFPEAPTLNTAVPGVNQVTLSWSEGTSAASYIVYYGTATGVYDRSLPANNGTSLTVSNLKAGQRYYFAVTAKNSRGESVKSNEKNVTIPISAPTTLTAPNVTATGFTLSWVASIDTNVVTGYKIDVAADSAFSNLLAQYTNKDVGNVLTTSISDLKPVTQYYARARVYDAVGNISAYSPAINVTTLPIPVPASPTLDSVVPGSDATIRLAWSSVDWASSYNLYYGESTGKYGTPESVANTAAYNLKGFTAGKTYFLAVSAKNTSGESVKSNEKTVRVPYPAPAAPVLNSAAPSDQKIKVGWTPVTGAAGYKVKYGTSTKIYAQTIDSGNVTTCSIPNLTNGTLYFIAVTAYNADAESLPSNEVIAKPYAISSVMYVTSVTYDQNGQVTQIKYGNGDVTTNSYDPINLRLTRLVTVNKYNQTLQDLNCSYDGVGDILTIVDKVNTASQTFQYDHLNRLIYAKGAYGTKIYTYNEIGNIQNMDGRIYTYGENGAGPHAVTSLSDNSRFAYDANGNMATRKVSGGYDLALTYDAENHLIGISKNGTPQETFSYDGDGGRTKVAAGGMLTKYVGPLYEEDNFGSANHIFLGSTRVSTVRNGNQLFYHTDHLGGTNVTTDYVGTVKEKFEYEPYGNTARHDTTGLAEETTKYNFTGKESDGTSGLYFYGARYYDPAIGRFIQADTIVQAPNDPQTLNRYSYCGNNPVNRIDPSGHSWWKKWWKPIVTIAVGIVVGVLTAGIGSVFYSGIVGAQWGVILSAATSGAIAGAASGAVGGALSGQNVFRSAMMGAAYGALSGAVFGGINNLGNNTWNWEMGLTKVGLSSVAGGGISELRGGSFAQGAMFAGAVAGSDFIYRAILSTQPEGENQGETMRTAKYRGEPKKDIDGKVLRVLNSPKVSNVGFASQIGDNSTFNFFMGETGPVMSSLGRFAPGFQGLSLAHDITGVFFTNILGKVAGSEMGGLLNTLTLNFPTMPVIYGLNLVGSLINDSPGMIGVSENSPINR